MDKLKIEGVTLKQLKIIQSFKGDVLHMMRNDEQDFKSFGECYFSEINPLVIKGWKKHIHQTQNFSVPVGRIKIVLLDDRKDSKTFENIIEIILGRPDLFNRIKIPPGIYYSFKCLSTHPSIIVNITDIPHDINESLTIELNNNHIPYKWN
tara:strand:+ start:272 stop:724 length:453 start_codon:yes stop_codon:yes gene_type:complete